MKKLFQFSFCLVMFIGYNLTSASTNNNISSLNINGDKKATQISTIVKNNQRFPTTYESSISPTLMWTEQVGNYQGYTYATGVSSDSNNGNNYVVGYTNVGISGQIQNGSNDYFVAKSSEFGDFQWSRQVGAFGGSSYATGVSLDSNGNIYVVGYTTIGLSGQPQNGKNDYFIAKYDQNSNLLWATQVGAAGGYSIAYGVSVDSQGNVYIVGTTNVGLSGQPQNGFYDYFIAKYDQYGNLNWARQVGSKNSSASATGVSTDSNGNIYAAGWTNAGISGQIQNGVNDYFLAKYDQYGNLIWTKEVGVSGGTTQANGVSADINGNVYVTGYTNKGIAGQIQNGKNDGFISKYYSNGDLIWVNQFGAVNGTTQAYGVSADNNGNVYVTGGTNVALYNQRQNGINDYFITQYDKYGDLVWSIQGGNPNGNAYANGISTDSSNNIFIAGKTDVGLSGQMQQGYEDYFVARYVN